MDKELTDYFQIHIDRIEAAVGRIEAAVGRIEAEWRWNGATLERLVGMVSYLRLPGHQQIEEAKYGLHYEGPHGSRAILIDD